MPELGELPADVPKAPWQVYADTGWKGMGDWLGTGRIATRLMVYRSFAAASSFVRKLKLKSSTEWRAYCMGELPKLRKLPADVPNAPMIVYLDKGWKGMGDWLGNNRPLRKKRKSRA